MTEFPTLVRTPYSKPSHPDNARSIPSESRTVVFRHPGYNEDSNILLTFPGLDPGGGIHHETARIACCIIADNKWHGYFAKDREGKDKVETPEDSILTGGEYYFHVPDAVDKFPIVPTFNDWRFPHNDLPEYWQKCEVPKAPEHEVPRWNSTNLSSRDISCRVTAHRESVEMAHLLPASEQTWFNQNQMGRYNATMFEADPVNNGRNRILLRSDIHTLFDARKLTIIPKRTSIKTGKPTFVAHTFIEEVDSEVAQLYHNVALQPLSGIVVQFLFARLAWTLFYSLHIFLTCGVTRNLRVRTDNGYSTQEFSGEQCKDKWRLPRTRSVSPKKRKPDAAEQAQDEEREDELECERRGRKRRRSSISPPKYSNSDTSASSTNPSFYNTDTDHSEIAWAPREEREAKEMGLSMRTSRIA